MARRAKRFGRPGWQLRRRKSRSVVLGKRTTAAGDTRRPRGLLRHTRAACRWAAALLNDAWKTLIGRNFTLPVTEEELIAVRELHRQVMIAEISRTVLLFPM